MRLSNESLVKIAASINTQAFANAVPIIVFNPVASQRTDTAIAQIQMSGSTEDFALLDDAGNAIPFDVCAHSPTNFDIEFIARDVPGHGYRTFQVKSSKAKVKSTAPDAALVSENEFFIVEPNPADGTLTITDKTTGAIYRGANRFVDGGDCGDLYNYCPPEKDTRIVQPSAPPQITIERGAARESLHIAMNYRLPAQIADDRAARSREMVDENIVAMVSLYPGVRRIDFRVAVDNRARDHRLRVEFPTPIVTAYANADQAFDVVTRALDLPTDTATWIEQPRPEAPMQTFVSVSDGKIGLTLATRGLPEYEVRRDPHPDPPPLAKTADRGGSVTLALTLLRCTGWLSRNDLTTRVGLAGPAMETPGAQEIGKHVFEYALIPHSGDWRNAFAEAYAFAAPLRAVATDVHAGTLATAASFVEVSPREFVIRAIKLPEEGAGLIVRGCNISTEPIDVTLRVWREFTRAARVNLNEEMTAPLELRDGREVAVRARAKEIVTVRLE